MASLMAVGRRLPQRYRCIVRRSVTVSASARYEPRQWSRRLCDRNDMFSSNCSRDVETLLLPALQSRAGGSKAMRVVATSLFNCSPSSQADAAAVWRVVRARSASRAWLTATREAAVAAVDWSAGGVGELNRFHRHFGATSERAYGQNERYWQSDTSYPRVSIVYGTRFRAPRAV